MVYISHFRRFAPTTIHNFLFSMAKFMLVFLCAFLATSLFSNLLAQEAKAYNEKEGANLVKFYADNPLPCPVSFQITFTEANNICGGKDRLVVIEPNVNRQFLFSIKPCNLQQKWSYYWKYTLQYGDANKETYNANISYSLPFPKGTSYKVGQGFMGNFSHKDTYAVDFTMPEGSEVCAMRDGIVVQAKGDSDKGGPDISFDKFANVIRIYHPDGTIGMYLHFQKDGVNVSVGDKVKRGQVIGYSGNTGFSSRPHLHVEVYSASPTGKKTIEPKFKINGAPIVIKQGAVLQNGE
ncbi:MAG: M23 family metallopeptidase [Bacteroidetes bacterium]|nr:MAG: M23 family metallopeptidase [Bacteroidota bacterium]